MSSKGKMRYTDDSFPFNTNEINNKRIDRVSSTKFETVEFPIAQGLPK